MNPKHLAVRIQQCLALAEASNCPRRKFGALLLDPARNVILVDGYNGGPRGGGELCGGDRCLRDGLKPEQVVASGPNGPNDDDPEDWHLTVCGKPASIPRTGPLGWKEDVLAERDRLLAENPPIPSGKRVEVGCHHAEMNVICNAAANGTPTNGAWLIVTGEPCIMCAKLLHHAGIAKVICVSGGYAGGSEGTEYLRRHKVAIEFVDGPQDPRLAKV